MLLLPPLLFFMRFIKTKNKIKYFSALKIAVMIFFLSGLGIIFFVPAALADQVSFGSGIDSDEDGLPDELEAKYATNSQNFDTDGDRYADGEEIKHGYDPLVGGNARLPKRIDIDLSEQRLRYYYGEYGEQGNFLISSGIKRLPSPKGKFSIIRKVPSMLYKGPGYYYPRTKWNMQFYGPYFIHGAYWHNNFGKPMSHGCINVAYKDMESLYNFTDLGTEVVIHE